MPSSPWKMIIPQGLICIFWAESLSEYQLCIPVKVRQTPAIKDWSLLLFPWQALPCKNQLFSLPFLSLIRVQRGDFRFRRLLTNLHHWKIKPHLCGFCFFNGGMKPSGFALWHTAPFHTAKPCFISCLTMKHCSTIVSQHEALRLRSVWCKNESFAACAA